MTPNTDLRRVCPRIIFTIQRSSLTLNSPAAINGAVYCHFSIKWCLNSCIQNKSFLIHFFLPQCEKWRLWIMAWKVYHYVKEHTLAPTLFRDPSHTIISTFQQVISLKILIRPIFRKIVLVMVLCTMFPASLITSRLENDVIRFRRPLNYDKKIVLEMYILSVIVHCCYYCTKIYGSSPELVRTLLSKCEPHFSDKEVGAKNPLVCQLKVLHFLLV